MHSLNTGAGTAPSVCAQDPLADGPVIQGAATRALEKGVTLDAVIDMVRKVSPTIKAPLVMFTYYNPIMRRGMDKFMAQIKEAGASGMSSSGVCSGSNCS